MIHDERGLLFSFLNGSLKARVELKNFREDRINQARDLLFEHLSDAFKKDEIRALSPINTLP